MRVGYLTNQYPKVSHSFIRREIQALEQRNVEVRRYSVRQTSEALVDPGDQEEQRSTHVLLGSAPALLLASARAVGTVPARLARATALVVREQLRADRGPLPHAAYLAEACALKEVAARDRIEHLHAHFGTNAATVAWLCHVLGGPPFSFTVHGPEEFDRARSIGLRAKALAARFVVAISEFGRSQLCRLLPQDAWSKVHVVRCGLDRKMLSRDTPPPQADAGLLCIGRLSEQKGHHVLLEAAAELKARGRAFRLVLVGDGELRDQVERRIRDLDLGAHIELRGNLSEQGVIEAIEQCRALVLPSLAEGLPVVIMETMALGRPVLSTFIAGIPELVFPGKNGWLVPAGSAEELVRTMIEVLDTPQEEIVRLGNAAREAVRQRHDIARSAEQLEQLFRGVS